MGNQWPGVPNSSIAKKIIMALTGLLLIGFLGAHLAGNLLLFKSAAAFNAYAHALTQNRFLLYPAEFILAALFLYHIVMGIKLTLDNRRARPQAVRQGHSPTMSLFAAYTMIISGLIIAVFLVVHIKTFKFGAPVNPPTDGVRDLYSIVVARFAEPWYSAFYIIALSALGLHLSHALQSALKSMGIMPQCPCLITWVSRGIAIAFTVGFCSFPVYFFLTQG